METFVITDIEECDAMEVYDVSPRKALLSYLKYKRKQGKPIALRYSEVRRASFRVTPLEYIDGVRTKKRREKVI